MQVPAQIEAFPLWAQVIVTIVFGIAALVLAIRGYTKPEGVQKTDAMSSVSLAAASIMDSGSIRHLSDTIIHLDGDVVRLDHNVINLTQEIRLLREELARERNVHGH